MRKLASGTIAAIILLLFCVAVLAGDKSYRQTEEKIIAEIEALIDKTGRISAEDNAACIKLLRQGIQEHDKGEYGKAVEFYEKALKKNPLSAIAYYEMGFSYHSAGDQQKALDAVVRSLVLDPKSEASLVMKAGILDDMGFSDDAVDAYRKIIELKPDSFLAHLNLGITLLRKRDVDQARQELMRAHEIAPEHPSPFLHLSACAKFKGETYEEEKYLNEFVRVAKNDPRLPAVQQRLKELKSSTITLSPPNKNDAVGQVRGTMSLMEGLLRARWKQELHRKTFPDAKTYFPSFEEELEVIYSVLEIWKEEKAKNPSLSDPVYNLAEAAQKKGYLNEYVWYMHRKKLGERADAWFKDNKQKVDEFVDWAAKAGYQDLVKDKVETNASEKKPSIGIRELPALVLKVAEQSKLSYQMGTAKPEEGAKFRKQEGDRYRDEFRKSGLQCVTKKEARETLKGMAGNVTTDAYLKVVRVFMPGDEEWNTVIPMISRMGNRYRDLAPPASASGLIEKQRDKIRVGFVDPAWIPYYLAKALWRYEPGFRKRFGGSNDDKPSVEEEEFALAAMAGGILNARDSKENKSKPDPYLDVIESAFAAKMQTGFVLFEIIHKAYGVPLECLPSSQAEELRNYFLSIALERIKAEGK